MSLTIRFGALAEPIHTQMGVDAKDVKLEQRLADAITLLNVHDVATDQETRAMRRRVLKTLHDRFTPNPHWITPNAGADDA